ncbi:MAG: murein biosynthesis integral membrane protein MurJ [Desulfobacca sp.]|uniref:murein biosynthesis integral membrane protein MurJ n=1 Tax=Desulfobacca sp. TaxID=2067990 RepID=UPI0040493DEA
MKQTASSQTGTIARSAGTVGVAVLCSRLLGLIREQVLANFFGAGMAMDAFVVAFRLPNLLRDLFAEGALSAAFVTVMTDYDQRRGPAATWRLVNNTLITLTILVGGIALAGILAADVLVRLMAPDFGLVPGKTALTVIMTQIMFPFLPLISLAAVVMGILNTRGKFFMPAMASSFFNLGSITTGVALALVLPHYGVPGIIGMAVGTLLGGGLQLAVQLPSLRAVGYRLQWVMDWRDEGLRRIFRLMTPAVIGLSATQINIFINTFFASSCAEGSVAWLNYAFRLLQFPIGVFGVAISVAAMPVVSRLAAQRDFAGLKEAFVAALTMSLLVAVPAAVGLAVLAEPIIALIFQHGRFTAFDTAQTAGALVFYSLGLFAYAGVKVVVPVFYALHNTKYPVIGSFLAVAANFLLVLLTLAPLQHRAIALATSLSMILNFIFLSAVLYWQLQGYPLGQLACSLAKILLAAGAMGCLVSLLAATLQPFFQAGFLSRLAALAAAMTMGVLTYTGLIHFLGIPEFAALTLKLRQRLWNA